MNQKRGMVFEETQRPGTPMYTVKACECPTPMFVCASGRGDRQPVVAVSVWEWVSVIWNCVHQAACTEYTLPLCARRLACD